MLWPRNQQRVDVDRVPAEFAGDGSRDVQNRCPMYFSYVYFPVKQSAVPYVGVVEAFERRIENNTRPDQM